MAVEAQGHILPKVGSPYEANHPHCFPSQGKGEEPFTGWEAQPDGAGSGSLPCVSVPGLSRGVESTCVKVTAEGGSGVLSHSNRATVIAGICYIFQN